MPQPPSLTSHLFSYVFSLWFCHAAPCHAASRGVMFPHSQTGDSCLLHYIGKSLEAPAHAPSLHLPPAPAACTCRPHTHTHICSLSAARSLSATTTHSLLMNNITPTSLSLCAGVCVCDPFLCLSFSQFSLCFSLSFSLCFSHSYSYSRTSVYASAQAIWRMAPSSTTAIGATGRCACCWARTSWWWDSRRPC